MTVNDVLDVYSKHLENTISKRRALGIIKTLRCLGRLQIKDVAFQIQAYIDGRGKSAGTINRELGVLQSALRYAFKRGVIDYLPAIQKLPSPPPRSKFLDDKSIKKLLDDIKDDELLRFVKIALMTGQRKQAILNLTWEQVDFNTGLIDFNEPTAPLAHRMKGRGVVPMSSALKAFLSGFKRDSGRVFGIRNIDRQWAGIREKFGITPHILRHTVATQLARKSVPMTQIAKILGHRNTVITERVYAKFSPEFCRDAVKHLSV
jgi:integrase